MNSRRWLAALLLAAGFLGLAVSQADAFPRRFGPTVGYSWGPAWSYGPAVGYPYYQAYVMPLPAYGILPPPLATYNMLYGAGGARPTDDFYYRSRDYNEPAPRARPNLYPAVPNDKKGDARVEDLRRVRFDISVPYENAVVFFDGAKTTQTGVRRVYMTPPLEEDKQYVMTIKVEFTDKAGDRRIRESNFTVVSGQIVTHTFVE